jgi:arsenate reductase
MDKLIIYHNGECSKSKGALELLQDAGASFDVRWYLADPLTKEELKTLLHKLGMQPSEIIRKGEQLYKELFEGRHLTEEQWLDALAEYPVLLERPIVEKGNKAIVARPPEIVNTII